MIRWIIITTLGISVALAKPVAAQLNSLPVFVSPKGGTGFTLAADYGKGLNSDSEKSSALAVRALLGLSAFSIGGGIATLNPTIGGLDTEVQYMGNAAMRLIGGALFPFAVNLHGGVGYVSRDMGGVDRTELTIPVGLGAAINVPLPAFSLEPWVAPRYTLRRLEIGDVDDTQGGFGLSVGVNLGFAMGLGVHAALDWTDLDAATLLDPGDVAATQPAVLGIGVNYTFRLPSPPGL